MSIKKLLIVAGALAVAACGDPTGNLCAYQGHGDELDTSECVLQDAITETPQGVAVTEEIQ
jgi:hypothetical protein